MTLTYKLMDWGNAEIYIKRDDLLPFSFGGNKYRIGLEVFSDMKEKGYDAIISYGSLTSNLNRVLTHMAGMYGLPCYVVCKKEESEIEGKTKIANEQMVLNSGAQILYCSGTNVGETVKEAIELSKSKGEKPYYIYGDTTGHGHETVLMRAYIKAFDEITEFEEQEGFRFERIFLPTGTGSTHSGLIAASLNRVLEGKDEKAHVIYGISTARAADKESAIIKTNLELYYEEQKANAVACGRKFPELPALEDHIFLTDQFLSGGYGHSDEGVKTLIRQMINTKGLPLDTIYTGKAFYGMTKIIEEQNISGKVLFIHTGGLPEFFDEL